MKTVNFSLLRFLGFVLFAYLLAGHEVVAESEMEPSAPVEAPAEMDMEITKSPSSEPTFKEGDLPVAFPTGTIEQPVFEAPVTPPPISEAGRTDARWMATSAAIVLAAAL